MGVHDMSEVLVLEFAGVSADHYQAVNKILQVDSSSGEGDWPAGLHSHVAGSRDDRLVVVEVWESQDAQESFMARLGPALGQAGVPQPVRMDWLAFEGQYHD
jgi:hypothetical protein